MQKDILQECLGANISKVEWIDLKHSNTFPVRAGTCAGSPEPTAHALPVTEGSVAVFEVDPLCLDYGEAIVW